MKKLPNLPTGESSFEVIRESNNVYVDKTRHIFRMVDRGKYYFLSRPRRFGKSLTVSTLKCLFQGRRELFEGLWIAENTDWEWQKHPVVIFDFNELSHDTLQDLKTALRENMSSTAKQYGVRLNSALLQGQFRELIVGLFQKTGQPVVILVDEYDKPIIDHLGRGAQALKVAIDNRNTLKSFFGVLKGISVVPCLRLVFITGVSKFSRVSIFSELNNLDDITMNRHYAEILGYTQGELETSFAEHLAYFTRETGQSWQVTLDNLEAYYNGYRFSEKDVRVYNPFSILKALSEQAFKNYWFETGTPTLLVNILKNRNYPVAKIENLQLDEQIFSVYDIENLQPEALLFQTGYITIREVLENKLYTFQYPNREVKSAFLTFLLLNHLPGNSSERSMFRQLSGYLQQEELEAFFATVHAIFKSIPYTIESKRDEAYFHTAFFLMVSASGVELHNEVLTCDGRIDLVMHFADKTYIIEFKCNQSAAAALAQIREKGYADPYRSSGKTIICLGINFDTETRNVADWQIEYSEA